LNQDEKENSNIKHVDLEYLMAMGILGYRLLTVKHELKPNVNEGKKSLQKAAEAGEVIAMRKCGNYLIHEIIK